MENYVDIKTGEIEVKKIKFVLYNFDNYSIKVRLDEEDKFLGIDEVEIKKSFLENNKNSIVSPANLEEYFIFEEE